MESIRKIWKYATSMQFAIILLVILVLACIFGSLVTQGQTYDWYAAKYNERVAALIIALHLDDAFHSWWFIGIAGFLCFNLLFCNIIRIPQLYNRTKKESDPEFVMRQEGDAVKGGVRNPEAVFFKLHMHPRTLTVDNRTIMLATKNRIGIWGAWICHLGVLLLILGFGLGQMTKVEYAVYGVPGQTRRIDEAGLSVQIDAFEVKLKEDDTVDQYTAKITVWKTESEKTGAKETQSAEISVNNPARLYGYSFYQNSTGWAAKIHVQKNGSFLQEETVCAGDYLTIRDKTDLVVFLVAFYPDYVLIPGSGPHTVSGALNNPAYLYSVYYQGQMLGMNVIMPEEKLTIDEYEITFSDPQNYTLIQVKRDNFSWLALLGGIITMIGLFCALYLLPKKVWGLLEEDGSWTMKAACHKGGSIFTDEFNRATDEAEGAGIV